VFTLRGSLFSVLVHTFMFAASGEPNLKSEHEPRSEKIEE
jgi:hypothetical protein